MDTSTEYKLRLSDFMAEDDSESGFSIRMFANTVSGETASVLVEGFQPFFYLSVDDNTWAKHGSISGLRDFLKNKLYGDKNNELLECVEVRHKKLQWFDNGKLHLFIRVRFSTVGAFNRLKNSWYTSKQMPDGTKERTLIPNGIVFKCNRLLMYESNIPPLLRYFHIMEISPSGWISLPHQSTREQIGVNVVTTCKYNYVIEHDKIVSLADENTMVPYLKASFDIEASSSHGDFPLPIKTYKKLAVDIVDSGISTDQELSDAIEFAFGYKQIEVGSIIQQKINVVYPKESISSEDLLSKIKLWLTYRASVGLGTGDMNNRRIEAYMKRLNAFSAIDVDGDGDCDGDEDGDEDGGDDMNDDCDDDDDVKLNSEIDNNFINMDTHINVIELLTAPEIPRELKIGKLCVSLHTYFPPLEGDKVTFIGTTLMRYGQSVPHLNHCIVLGPCDDIPAENTVIECYDTEREVLVAWTRLINAHNPDIIMGYNIFSFDYEFMFRRAQECECVEEFLVLSRMKDAVCGKFDNETGEYNIGKSSMKLNNGNNTLNIIEMIGRIQIDMYYWLMRTETLPSYKLDFVGGYFIGDTVNKIVHEITDDGNKITRVSTKNMTGLFSHAFIHFDEIDNSTTAYKNGAKFRVVDVNVREKYFIIEGHENPTATTVKWGLAKDDVTPKDIFRLTNEGESSKAIVAKYCIQDCNIVHYLMNKIDVVTDLVEMAKLCSIPMAYLMFRGQGIKLTSYVAKKCREMNTLMPVIDGKSSDEGYDGAEVLEPKTGLYIEDPVNTGDYAGLYPSSMISENLCSSSKVWSKFYDTSGVFIREFGIKNKKGEFMYDNLPGQEYVEIRSETYKYIRTKNKIHADKIKTGHRISRFAQYPKGEYAVFPSILSELIQERKNTRKMIPLQTDDFNKNILNKRQKAIKVVANSVYGQTGAKTSTFYDMDIAASTTSVGRMLLMYSKEIIEGCYGDTIVETSQGPIRTKAEYIYGDTDSVFFNLNMHTVDTNKPLKGKSCLPLSIEVAQIVTSTVTKFLKKPHDFEYEKTYLPLCLLSKKRYVGMLYELDPEKGVRNEMGIVLKRLDNAPIVKVIYGGTIDILMKEQNIEAATDFVKKWLQNIVDKKVPIDKLIISKSLRSFYKFPNRIAHKVLADRITAREPGNKVSPGDRVPYIFIVNKDKKALMGHRIESPTYIEQNKNTVQIDYGYYIENQIMRPLLQLFGLIVCDYYTKRNQPQKASAHRRLISTAIKKEPDEKKRTKKIEKLNAAEVKKIIFDEFLRKVANSQSRNNPITSFFGKNT